LGFPKIVKINLGRQLGEGCKPPSVSPGLLPSQDRQHLTKRSISAWHLLRADF